MATQMEVDQPICSVMASPGTTGSVTVALHPLVIMNISEHWTRVKAQEGKPMQGENHKGQGQVNSEDAPAVPTCSQPKRLSLPGQYGLAHCLGETRCLSPTARVVSFEWQFFSINESPIFLQLNPQSRTSDLPISLYESVIDLVKGEATVLFVDIPYTLATEEAERIGVDHVARLSVADTGDSSTAEHLVAQHSSIKMLHNRIKVILAYIKAAQNGEVAKNHDVLREAYSLCYRLPVLSSQRFNEDYFTQCNDVCLMAYLGAMTKGSNTMNQFLNKFNVLYDKGMGRRIRGLFF
ncbi:COP9 signalosome complex subunit 6 [Elysia marginata]|uniref:COP9 signalosome complex subunit 6 n=1 Tax=Elysia marginata TaxID=1093978 RepID=A0AAV4G4I9_9GAST|nr:COP9 signalosome complex subunit 6 [Elysia marginata]